MKKSFVKYEVAFLAKEKGFDEPCFKVYDDQEFLQDEKEMDKLELLKVNAPLYQQVVDWLEVNHNIHVSRMWYNDSVTPTRWVYHIDGVYAGSDFDEALILALNRIK